MAGILPPAGSPRQLRATQCLQLTTACEAHRKVSAGASGCMACMAGAVSPGGSTALPCTTERPSSSCHAQHPPPAGDASPDSALMENCAVSPGFTGDGSRLTVLTLKVLGPEAQSVHAALTAPAAARSSSSRTVAAAALPWRCLQGERWR